MMYPAASVNMEEAEIRFELQNFRILTSIGGEKTVKLTPALNLNPIQTWTEAPFFSRGLTVIPERLSVGNHVEII